MTTLSTLTTLPPAPKKLPTVSIQDIWTNYFAGKHDEVFTDSNSSLFAGNAPDYLHVCGLSLMAKGRAAEGIVILRAALLLYPSAASWFANASIASLNANCAQDALDFATLGLARHDDPILHFAHGNALMHLNKLEEAQAPFIRAIEIKPDLYDARLNLGNVFRRLGQSEQALSLYNSVLQKDPNNGLGLINRAGVLIELNEHDEAAMVLLRIMSTADVPEVNFMMAMLRMIEGDLTTGFDLYRSRFDCAMAAPDKAQFRKPLITSLSQATNNHVLVSHEQGFGDSLQFIRYLPDIVANSKKLTLMVPISLHRLFEQVSPGVKIVSSRDEVGDYDLECPMLHLPYLFETTLETIPATIPYLTVPQDMIDSHHLPHRHPHTHKRVGLVWAGQMRPNPDLAAVDRRRSLTYSQIEPLFDVESVDFVSLQLGEPGLQIMEQGTKGKRRPHEILYPSMDFYDTAAYMMHLDLVITVDTAIAHLAGALGKPVWVLSRFDQCWRWMKNRDDSPWYPGVLRLFRQETRGDWTDALTSLKAALEAWAAE